MSVILQYCKTCELSFDPDEVSENTGLSLKEFHSKHSTIVEYDPKIHDKPEPILGNCVDSDPFDKEKFMAEMRNSKKLRERHSRLREHKSILNETIEIQDKEIKTLRPLTIDNDTKFILAYLPATITDEKGAIRRQNCPFFISKNSDGLKDITSAESLELKDDYIINVLSTSTSRWNVKDVLKYCDEVELINPKDVLDNTIKSIKKYFEYQDEADYYVMGLWAIGTYFYEMFNAYPYLDFTATKRSGKTKNLDWLKQTCYNAIKSSDISPSAQFRFIESIGTTILFDETENLKNPKSDKAQDTLTLLHTGFIKGDSAVRAEGKFFTPTEFRTYGPKGLAHINYFSDVLDDRCIEIPLLRSLNKKILDSDIDNTDRELVNLRHSFYRLFLDYADEIAGLIEQARELLDVSSRELKLWTPLITLALFFQNHDSKGITGIIKTKSDKIHAKRSQNDEEFSPEGRILRFIHERIRDRQGKDGSIRFKIIHDDINIYKSGYGFSDNFTISEKYLSSKLQQLGFSKIEPRTSEGWYYDVSNDKIDSALHRLGISFQATLGDKNVK